MSVVVGIAGGSGSGKTTVALALAETFGPDEVAVMPLDAYYRDRKGLSAEAKAQINYDHPDAFDQALLLEHVQMLRKGSAIELPCYDYARHERTDQTVPLRATPVILLEGILVLAMEQVVPHLDLRIYVDTDADVRFLRRLRRDMAERGRSAESVVEQYLATVRPMHHAFIEPTRHHADLILPGEGSYDGALGVLKAWARAVIEGKR